MPVSTEPILFEEEQAFRQVWLWALLGGVLMVLLVGLGLVILEGPDHGSLLEGVLALCAALALNLGAVVLLYVLKLKVRLDRAGLHVRFFPLVKRDIPLEQIARWESRRYRPILEYGGWGVRCGWKGMAYNVSGNRGVQLQFTNGKRLLIGSQRPEELAAAISAAKQQG